MKIRRLFLINFLIISFLTTVGACSAFFYLQETHQKITQMINSNLQEVNATSEISFQLNKLNNWVLFTLLFKDENLTNNLAQLEVNIKKLKDTLTKWQVAIDYERKNSQEDNVEIGQEAKEMEAMLLIEKNINNYVAQLRNLSKLSSISSEEKKVILKNVFMPLSSKINRDVATQQHLAQTEFNDESEQILNSFIFNSWVSLLVLVIILVTNTIISILMAQFIINRLNKFKSATKHLSDGHYDVKVDFLANDEFGDLANSFNSMVANISNYKIYIENIINTMPSMLIITSTDYKILLVNNRLLQDLGFEKNEILNKNLETLFLDPDVLRNITLQRQLKNSKVTELKTILKTKDKESIPVLFLTASMQLEDRKQKLIHIGQNISATEKMERELMKVARQAGMAEIATYILHNIGNVLNSINTSVLIINEKALSSPLHKLPKIAEIIEKNKDSIGDFLVNNEQGKLVPKYLSSLAKQWEHENTYLNKEILLIKTNIEHINKIIQSQQTLAGLSITVEVVNIVKLLEEALRLNSALYKNTSIIIEEDYKPIKQVKTNHAKLLQAIVNLISNSIAAVLESKNTEKKILLSIYEKNNEHFNIDIRDNGIGILSDNINKIFSYGFTTKESGHGFGLHGCALNIKEMKGSIEVFSKGLEKGTYFTLTLPYDSTIK